MWGQLLFVVAMLGALGAIAFGRLNLAGLTLDIVGVVLLAWEEVLKQTPAFVRYLGSGEGATSFKRDVRRVAWYKRIILRAARRWGSSDVMDAGQQPLFESFPIKAWGLILLALGFALQAVGGIRCG